MRHPHPPEGLLSAGDKGQPLARNPFATHPTYQGAFILAGVDDNYFMTAALDLSDSAVEYRVVSVPPPSGSKDPPRDLISFAIAPRQPSAIKIFAGPKYFDVRQAIKPVMTHAIHFGRIQVS